MARRVAGRAIDTPAREATMPEISPPVCRACGTSRLAPASIREGVCRSCKDEMGLGMTPEMLRRVRQAREQLEERRDRG
jgi:hypothetical protein